MGEAIKTTTWATGGCKSWYFDKSGVPNLYPWFPMRYLKEMHQPGLLRIPADQIAACHLAVDAE